MEQFRRELDGTGSYLIHKMAKQVDKYHAKLYADPIDVITPGGKIMVYPQRTNNIMGQLFRMVRRGQRRKTGSNSMSRTLQTMLAKTPLVKNLDNPSYIEILFNGKGCLEELFAGLEANLISSTTYQTAEYDRMFPGFRTLLKSENLLEQVAKLFMANQNLAKSN